MLLATHSADYASLVPSPSGHVRQNGGLGVTRQLYVNSPACGLSVIQEFTSR